MEALRRFGLFVHEFWRGTIEWRSPASAPYLMVVNVAFWSTALYCSELVQLRLLLTLAAGVVGWDVLLSPTHERSIATHVALWPLQSIWRTLSVCGCLYSSHQLSMHQLETACIAAYATVGCLLINPVWTYYEVNQKIGNGVMICGRKTADIIKLVIIHPLHQAYRALKYVLLLQFIPPMWNCLMSFLTGIRLSIRNGCGFIVTSIKASFRLTCNWCKNMINRIRTWILEAFIRPVKRAFYIVGRWLRYWLCAHWWPDLKLWIRNNIIEPLYRVFNYFCFGLVYICCGHWLAPLWMWVRRWLDCLKDSVMTQTRKFYSFFHCTVMIPTKNFLLRKFNEFRDWLRVCLHRLAVIIRDSVLWPICVLIVDVGRELCLLLYRLLLQPVLSYLYQRYKIMETAMLIYFLGPVCDTIVKHIPEKSPFCDDSDVELEGMLPNEFIDKDEQMDISGRLSDDLPDDSESSTSGDHDFTSGLVFPTIHASESSDDEFDLKVKQEPPKRRHQKHGGNGVKPYPNTSDLMPISVHRPDNSAQSFDNEFEVLQ